MKKLLSTSLACAALLGFPAVSQAIVTLTDGNSVVQIDPESQSGTYSWQVNGVNNLFQQWFWYRIGSSGPESSIDTIDTTPSVVSTPTHAEITYTGSGALAGLEILVKYDLTGGTAGSPASDIAETIRIRNTSGSALDFHFFQYSDFDLNGTQNDDIAVFSNANTVRQYDSGVELSETVVTPAASHREINTFSNTRDSLNDGSPTTLSDTPAIGVAQGPGDETWAFQWDSQLAAGNGELLISKDKNLTTGVPEGGTSAMLLGFGLMALEALRRKLRRA